MKRSEMMAIIRATLRTHNIDQDDLDVVSDDILDTLEKVGMKPPTRIPKVTQYGEPNGFNIGEMTWQDEDDDIGISRI